MKLQGQVAAITGGTAGIGRGIAEAFLAEGASVALMARNPDKARAALDEIGAGERAIHIAGDATVQVDIEGFIDRTVAHFGRLDILVNNAGGATGLQPLAQLSDAAFDEAMKWNVYATFWACRRALQTMPTRNRIHTSLGNTLLMLGHIDEARREYLAVPPDNLYRMIGLAFAAARSGNPASAEQQRASIVGRYGDSAHYQYAQIDAQMGKRDRAFSELELAWKFRDPGLASIKVDAFVDPLRTDPRYAAVIAKLNFP